MKRGTLFLAFFLSIALVLSFLTLSWAQAPSLSMKDSIKLAEGALIKASMNLTDYYLYSITLAHASKGDNWYYTFRAVSPSEYNEVFVKVYMDGETEISGGALGKKGY
jgi:hypothetical protein